MKTDKNVLDACCGSRMMWHEKANPLVFFGDIRDEQHILCDGRTLQIHPDALIDFRALPFADKTFKLIAFDPPHLKSLGQNSWMAKKYGRLTPMWQDDIRAGFAECWRVLDVHGTLIFKWNEDQIALRDVAPLFPAPPMFGHTTGNRGKTIWLTFFKTD